MTPRRRALALVDALVVEAYNAGLTEVADGLWDADHTASVDEWESMIVACDAEFEPLRRNIPSWVDQLVVAGDQFEAVVALAHEWVALELSAEQAGLEQGFALLDQRAAAHRGPLCA